MRDVSIEDHLLDFFTNEVQSIGDTTNLRLRVSNFIFLPRFKCILDLDLCEVFVTAETVKG